MKKIYSMVILLGILMLFPKVAFATEYWEKENKKREKAYEVALESYMREFMTEDTPEEDRIVSYEMNGYGLAQKGETEDKLYVSITFAVTPVNENHTTWSSYRNHCFAVFSKINDTYILDSISRYPDHYDEFLKRFEEYKKNKQENTQIEKTEMQGKVQNSLAKQEIQKINTKLIIGFGILFILSSICFLFFIKLRFSHK